MSFPPKPESVSLFAVPTRVRPFASLPSKTLTPPPLPLVRTALSVDTADPMFIAERFRVPLVPTSSTPVTPLSPVMDENCRNVSANALKIVPDVKKLRISIPTIVAEEPPSFAWAVKV